MAFIDKKDPVVINIKLTSKGRELLSTGKLSFDYYALGDSEIDYNFIAETGLVPFDSTILRPADNNPNILSFIPRTPSGDPYNLISTVPTTYQVINSIEPIGFFTNSGTSFITDSNHVKQPDVMVDMSVITGGRYLTLLKAPTYGTSTEEPAIGDLLLIKWAGDINTTGHTINVNSPTPYLMYRIENIISGSLSNSGVVVEVDRDLPDFSSYSLSTHAGALIYYNFINYTGSSIFNMSSTEYLDESVLSFLENSQCPTVVFPFWNMTIIFTEEIAGVTADKLKFSQFDSRTYGGFVSYIQNQAPFYKKLGVIHYTNSSPANVYGEGFYLKTTVLDIPMIMWHKSSGATLGARFVPTGDLKILGGETTSLNAPYYDLADLEGNVVGKVFPELKIFVIEDQELLFAMSYKSNRSWTLPEFYAGTTELPDCPELTPVVMWQPITINSSDITLVSREYCHSNSGGWVTISNPSETITCVGVLNTGYRVRVCNTTTSNVDLSIETHNTSDNCIIGVPTSTTIPPSAIGCVSISNFNNTNNYYFTGTAI